MLPQIIPLYVITLKRTNFIITSNTMHLFGVSAMKKKYFLLGIPLSFLSVIMFLSRGFYNVHFNIRMIIPASFDEYDFRPSDVGLQSSETWELLVNTENCKIPDVDPFDESIKRFLRPGDATGCDDRDVITYIDDGVLYINQTKRPKDVDYCKLFPIYRRGTHFVFGIGKKFHNYIALNDEFIKINCYNSSDFHLLSNFHIHFVNKAPLEKNQSRKSIDHFNILLIMIDSTSRVNSRRYLQNTRDFLSKKLGAVELLGYTKLGDNTLPNMTPFLTGRHLEDSPCMHSESGVDNCTFIWKEFAENGFLTHFAEDWPYASTFEFSLNGFKNQPTHYYDRPFYIALEQESKSMYDVCFHGRKGADYLNQRVTDIAENLQTTPYFSITIHSRMTHNYLHGLSRMDNLTVDNLSSLYERNLLKNTIVAVFGDHGMRFGPVRQTFIGQLEERLPMMYLYLPDRFKQKYPIFSNNIKTNARRLTTHFDMHATLLHVLDLNKPRFKTKWGISLFNKIPTDRTCEDAGIKSHWCTCNYHMQAPDNDAMKTAMGKHFVQHLNNLTSTYQNKCARLRLATVISSMRLLARSTGTEGHRIVIKTQPGGGKFEATVQYKNEGFPVISDISRVNKYAGKSDCIKADRMLKKICNCF